MGGAVWALLAQSMVAQTLIIVPSGDMCCSGAAAVDGALYWGTGYRVFGEPGQALYAFTVNGQ